MPPVTRAQTRAAEKGRGGGKRAAPASTGRSRTRAAPASTGRSRTRAEVENDRRLAALDAARDFDPPSSASEDDSGGEKEGPTPGRHTSAGSARAAVERAARERRQRIRRESLARGTEADGAQPKGTAQCEEKSAEQKRAHPGQIWHCGYWSYYGGGRGQDKHERADDIRKTKRSRPGPGGLAGEGDGHS